MVDTGEAAAGCGKEHVNPLTERVSARSSDRLQILSSIVLVLCSLPLSYIFIQFEPINISLGVRRQEREASAIHTYYQTYVHRVTS